MIPFALVFASPAMFPGHSPFAVWIGMGCIAVALGLLWKADDFGNCEGGFRADEAREWLERMNDRRIA